MNIRRVAFSVLDGIVRLMKGILGLPVVTPSETRRLHEELRRHRQSKN